MDGTLHGRGEAEYANGERFEGVSQIASGRPCGGEGRRLFTLRENGELNIILQSIE